MQIYECGLAYLTMKTLTVKETAQRLRVSVRTVMTWLDQDKFPHAFKAGFGLSSAWRIPEEDIQAIEQPGQSQQTTR